MSFSFFCFSRLLSYLRPNDWGCTSKSGILKMGRRNGRLVHDVIEQRWPTKYFYNTTIWEHETTIELGLSLMVMRKWAKELICGIFYSILIYSILLYPILCISGWLYIGWRLLLWHSYLVSFPGFPCGLGISILFDQEFVQQRTIKKMNDSGPIFLDLTTYWNWLVWKQTILKILQ